MILPFSLSLRRRFPFTLCAPRHFANGGPRAGEGARAHDGISCALARRTPHADTGPANHLSHYLTVLQYSIHTIQWQIIRERGTVTNKFQIPAAAYYVNKTADSQTPGSLLF